MVNNDDAGDVNGAGVAAVDDGDEVNGAAADGGDGDDNNGCDKHEEDVCDEIKLFKSTHE